MEFLPSLFTCANLCLMSLNLSVLSQYHEVITEQHRIVVWVLHYSCAVNVRELLSLHD